MNACMCMQGGDVERNSLPNAVTTRVPSFPDENFELEHTGPGILSMANAGMMLLPLLLQSLLLLLLKWCWGCYCC